MGDCKRSAFLLFCTSLFASGISVTLTPSIPSPAPLGQLVTWQANATGSTSLRYRFRVRSSDISPLDKSMRRKRAGAYEMIRDFGTSSSLDWTVGDHEGMYEIEVTAKDATTGDSAVSTAFYQYLSRSDGTSWGVNPTNHPLVFLFSMPPCDPQDRVRIEFYTGAEAPQYTPYKPCEAGLSMNFYLAGMRANTDYSALALIDDHTGPISGPILPFHTGTIPAQPWTQQIQIAAPAGATQPVLLATSAGSQIATDLTGRVTWYNPAPFTWGTRMEPGGYMWGIMEDPTKDVSYQSIRKVDLTGMTVLETNAETVNTQLVAMGKRKITGFHHEVRDIANNRIVALAGVEQIITGVQGPAAVDIVGDMVIVFDDNLNVVWTWDTFDHLDVTRASTTNDKCTPTASGCTPFYLASTANDWTHCNSVQETPDGQILLSSRHQDWLFKIDYNNGIGTGNILWRLGIAGDFTNLSSDPYPWFTHQHDANFETSNPSRLLVFDNGNLRVTQSPGNSRGQVIDLDQVQHTAKLVLNADLGVLSIAVGSAQALQNGNYHFDAGVVIEGSGMAAYSFEVDPTGKIVFKTRVPTLIYRSFRMADLYSTGDSI